MQKPFNLPMLPVTIDYTKLIRGIGAARTAIGELSGLLVNVKNPDLLIAPLLTNEAVLSSKIEGTIATVEDVYIYEAQNIYSEKTEKEKDIQEIINYRKAVEVAVAELRTKPISENFIKRLHYILMDSVRGENKQRGEFRKTQVHIGKIGSPTEEASYIPPIASKIPSLFSNFEKYIHSEEEQDELVQTSIVHYQFEAIHPFLDGNGRIGRLLIPLILYEKKLLPYPILYISSFFEKNRAEYYSHLNNVSNNSDWVGWIKYFLKALESQAIQTKNKVYEMGVLYEKMKIVINKLSSTFAIELLDILQSKPVINYNSVKDLIDASPQTIYNLIEKFCEAGVLSEIPGKKRNKTYIYSELMRIIQS
ncbi:MAG: Fic family protein [Spirochaetia bacterium]|nr:Fic family protein [Spirochaetia bacterium]